MPVSDTPSETVVFELPDGVGARRLCERLRPHWRGGCHDGDEAAIVSVVLRPAEGDLAALLRTVRLWARETAIGAIRFHLDGRAYLIEPANAVRPAAYGAAA
jgi:hypothetical protein